MTGLYCLAPAVGYFLGPGESAHHYRPCLFILLSAQRTKFHVVWSDSWRSFILHDAKSRKLRAKIILVIFIDVAHPRTPMLGMWKMSKCSRPHKISVYMISSFEQNPEQTMKLEVRVVTWMVNNKHSNTHTSNSRFTPEQHQNSALLNHRQIYIR